MFAATPAAASLDLAELLVRHADALACDVKNGRSRAEEALSRWYRASPRPPLPWLAPSALRPHLPAFAAEVEARRLEGATPRSCAAPVCLARF